MTTLRLGSRGSQLALFQAGLVRDRMLAETGTPVDIVVIKTSGDRLQHAPLSEIGGKRLFVKEIEDALLSRDIDLAVHSSKDMPAALPDGLAVGAVLPREDPADALILPHGSEGRTLDAIRASIGSEARIATGSVRRIAQLLPMFPAARFQNVRGNLDTRLRKLDSGECDLLVLAAAGLRRLGLTERISMTLPLADCIPAPGQGIIAIEIRADDSALRNTVTAINDAASMAALEAERELVLTLGGGCQMPIGGVALWSGPSTLDLHAVVASLDGTRHVRHTGTGSTTAAAALGREVGEYLLSLGAGEILRESGAQTI